MGRGRCGVALLRARGAAAGAMLATLAVLCAVPASEAQFCDGITPCLQGLYCTMFQSCQSCLNINPLTCDAFPVPSDCCTDDFLAQCPTNPFGCLIIEPTPAPSLPEPGDAGSGPGWLIFGVISGAGVFYVGAGVGYTKVVRPPKTRAEEECELEDGEGGGSASGAEAPWHPHLAYWGQLRGMVGDGFEYTRMRLRNVTGRGSEYSKIEDRDIEEAPGEGSGDELSAENTKKKARKKSKADLDGRSRRKSSSAKKLKKKKSKPKIARKPSSGTVDGDG